MSALERSNLFDAVIRLRMKLQDEETNVISTLPVFPISTDISGTLIFLYCTSLAVFDAASKYN